MRDQRAAVALMAVMMVLPVVAGLVPPEHGQEDICSSTGPNEYDWEAELVPLLSYQGLIGSIIHVGGAGPENHTSIQDGINASSDGDLVLVHSGSYNESVLLNRSIVLRGEGMPTIRSNSTLEDAIRVDSDNVIIEGFNITGAGNGIFMNASLFIIRDDHLFNNRIHIRWEKDYNVTSEVLRIGDAVVQDCFFNSTGSISETNSFRMRVNVSSDLSSWSVDMGSIEFNNNLFILNGSGNTALDLKDWVDLDTLNLSNFSFEGSNLTSNRIIGGGYGIEMTGDLSNISGCGVEIGPVSIKGNEFRDQLHCGAFIEGLSMVGVHNNSAVSVGMMEVLDNAFHGRNSTDAQRNLHLVHHNVTHITNFSSVGIDTLKIRNNTFVLNGTFQSTKRNVETGIRDMSNDMSGGSTFSYGGTYFEINELTSTHVGLYPEMQRIGVDVRGGSRVNTGDLSISGNHFECLLGIHIHRMDRIGSYIHDNSSVAMGNISFENNNLTCTQNCIRVSRIWKFGEYLYDSSWFRMGEMRWIDNVFDSPKEKITGLYGTEYFGYQLHDDSNVTIGMTRFNNNILRGNGSTGSKYAPFFLGSFLFDNSSFTYLGREMLGNIVHGSELVFSFGGGDGEYIYNSSQVWIGRFTVARNVISSPFKGLGIRSSGVLRSIWGNASCHHEGWTINNNTITASAEGIDIGRYTYHCSALRGSSSASLKGLDIKDNEIRSSIGIRFADISRLASYERDDSRAEVGPIVISGNNISFNSSGIRIWKIEKHGKRVLDSALSNVSPLRVINNTLIGDGVGLKIEGIYNLGTECEGDPELNIGLLEVMDNLIVSTDDGILVNEFRDNINNNRGNSSIVLSDLKIEGNRIDSQGKGIYIGGPRHSFNDNTDNVSITIGAMSFVSNTISASEEGMFILGVDRSCYGNKNNVSIRMGELSITNNVIASVDDGVYANIDFTYAPNHDNCSVLFSGVNCSKNEVDSGDIALNIVMGGRERRLIQNESISIGLIEVKSNEIKGKQGLSLWIQRYDAYDRSSLEMGEINISSNIVEATTEPGILLYRWMHAYGNASGKAGDIRISNNDITASSSTALFMLDTLLGGSNQLGTEVRVHNNFIHDSATAFWVNSSGQCYFYLNDIEDYGALTNYNDPQTLFQTEEKMGYKYGKRNFENYLGNYWGAYTGQDYDIDGIGDTPYNLTGNNDSYPLMKSVSEYFPPHSDDQSPILEIISPVNGTYFDKDTVTVTWNGSDEGVGIERYEIRIDEGNWTNKYNATSHTFKDLDNGEYSVEVRVRDWVGHWSQDKIIFFVDTISPEVAITSPTNDSVVAALPVNLTWELVDLEGNIGSIQFRVGSGPWKNVSHSGYHNIFDIRDGRKTLWVKVSDLAGNTVMDSVVISLDTTPPTLTIISPVNGSSTRESSMSFNWTGSDNYMGLKRYFISIDGSNAVDVGLRTFHTFYGLEEGYHQVRIAAQDNAGNMKVINWTISVDTSDPSISVTGLIDGNVYGRSDINISWFSDYTGSLLGNTTFMIDGNTVLPNGTRLEFSDLAEGNHTLNITVTDGAGNSEFVSISFTIDLTPPEILSFTPRGDEVSTDSDIGIIFSEKISVISFKFNNITIDGKLSEDGTILTYTPPFDLNENSDNTVYVLSKDQGGHAVVKTWNFTTREFPSGEGLVRGRVVDENGDPVSGARVVLDDDTTVFTDENGYFEIKGSAGIHAVKIYVDGELVGTVNVQIPDGYRSVLDDIELEGENKPIIGTAGTLMLIIGVIVILFIIAAYIMVRRKASEDERLARFEVEDDDYDEDTIFDIEE
ncbi:MAG: Ig-like domain-containing protein [Candidatus Thermoplasmatota archaeon]|nr:Ig-like domain-containing protein [Candidatus Thermoplasmatota archaeon]